MHLPRNRGISVYVLHVDHFSPQPGTCTGAGCFSRDFIFVDESMGRQRTRWQDGIFPVIVPDSGKPDRCIYRTPRGCYGFDVPFMGIALILFSDLVILSGSMVVSRLRGHSMMYTYTQDGALASHFLFRVSDICRTGYPTRILAM